MKRSRTKRQRRGGAMPYQYVQPGAPLVGASAGRDMMNGTGLTIRPRIGGSRRRYGGFVPSVMEGFVSASAKYITPIALFAAYKMINRPTKHRKSKKRSTRRR